MTKTKSIDLDAMKAKQKKAELKANAECWRILYNGLLIEVQKLNTTATKEGDSVLNAALEPILNNDEERYFIERDKENKLHAKHARERKIVRAKMDAQDRIMNEV